MHRPYVLLCLLACLGLSSTLELTPSMAACAAQAKEIESSKVLLAVMIESTGKGIDDLGKWDQCRDLGSSITQYCTLRYAVPVAGFPDPYLGLCVPSKCTPQDIHAFYDYLMEVALQRASNTSIPVEQRFIYGEIYNFGKGLERFEANTSAHANPVDMHCYPYDAPSPSENSGAVFMIVLCFLLVALVALGTLLDGYYSDWWPEVLPGEIVITEREALLPGAGSIQATKVVRMPEAPSNKGVQFLLSFSLPRNWNALLGPSPPALSFLNGVRAISIMWIILGHSLVYMNYAGLKNFLHVATQEVNKTSVQIIPASEFAVDTFFWLSGFLVTFLTLGELMSKKHSSGFFWGMYYFHRIWRLTPTYLFALFMYRNLSPYLGYGPMWNYYVENVSKTCGTNWWTNVIYVDNFVPHTWSNQCFLWGWYLAVDMQLYIIAPIILIGYSIRRWLGWGLVVIMLIATTVTNIVMAHHYHLQWNNPDPHVYMNEVYGKPYTRAAPWLLGIAVAFLHYEKRQLNRYVVLIGYALCATIMLLEIYGTGTQYTEKTNGLSMPKNEWSSGESLWYFSFAKLAWSLALSFVMLSFCQGYGGLVRRFLGAHFWNPFARLTYAMYLFHPIIMFCVYYSSKSYYQYSPYELSIYYVAFITLGFGTAALVFVSIERPFVNMEKLFLGRKKH